MSNKNLSIGINRLVTLLESLNGVINYSKYSEAEKLTIEARINQLSDDIRRAIHIASAKDSE